MTLLPSYNSLKILLYLVFIKNDIGLSILMTIINKTLLQFCHVENEGRLCKFIFCQTCPNVVLVLLGQLFCVALH